MLEYWREIGLALGGVITFLAGRKSTDLQDKSVKLDNFSKFQQIYDKYTADNEKQYSKLENKVDGLTLEIFNLNLRNAIIIEENGDWKKKFAKLQKLYDDLKGEFERYKEKHR